VSARDRTLAGVGAVLLLVGAYWFLLLAPKRAEAGKLAK
jgi:type II secretory pathway component PulM